MTTALAAVAYWGDRNETGAECAKRLTSYLRSLQAISPIFSDWYEKGQSRQEALKQQVDIDALAFVLAKGRNRRDVDRSVIEELGFHTGLWNGGTGASAISLSVTCGVHAGNPKLSNSLVVDRIDPSALTVGMAVGLVRAAAESWEPEWAAVCSKDALRGGRWSVERPLVDWVVFQRRRNLTDVPMPSRIAFEAHGGQCIVVQDVPPKFDDPRDRESVGEVARLIGLAE